MCVTCVSLWFCKRIIWFRGFVDHPRVWWLCSDCELCSSLLPGVYDAVQAVAHGLGALHSRFPFWGGLLHAFTFPWKCLSIIRVLQVQFSSVTQSCPTLCDPMNRSTPGLPIHHQLPEFTQTHYRKLSGYQHSNCVLYGWWRNSVKTFFEI